MEIEVRKPRKASENSKRRHSAILSLCEKSQAPSLKKYKLNNHNLNTLPPDSYHLSNLQKSFIYLQGALGTHPKVIAKKVERDTRSITSFMINANSNSNDVFIPKNKKKGRWVKGGTKLTNRHKEFINTWIKAGNVKSARQVHLRLNTIQNLSPISYNPVRIYMKSLGEFKKASLEIDISQINKTKRLKYCVKYQNFNFRKVLFSDESLFQLNGNNEKQFYLKGQKVARKKKFNPNTKIMVWAAISYQGKTSLKIVSDTLKTDGYLKILKEKRNEMRNLFRRKKIWYFQQDGAPSHRPKRIKQYIRRWITKRILPHPAQSPDLNPIELIWAQMKRRVEEKRPQSKGDLLRAILNSWESISVQDIRKCIDNLPKKIEKIIEGEGEIS